MALNIDYDAIEGPLVPFEIDDSTITFDEDEEGGSAQVGLAVRLVAGSNKTLALVGAGEGVLGILELVEADGAATVRTTGFMRAMKGDGALGAGTMKKLVGDVRGAAKGYVREVDDTDATELEVARGFAVDVSDADAVQIYLG